MAAAKAARVALFGALVVASIAGAAYGDDAYPASGAAGVGAVTSPMKALKEKALALSDTIVKCT